MFVVVVFRLFLSSPSLPRFHSTDDGLPAGRLERKTRQGGADFRRGGGGVSLRLLETERGIGRAHKCSGTVVSFVRVPPRGFRHACSTLSTPSPFIFFYIFFLIFFFFWFFFRFCFLFSHIYLWRSLPSTMLFCPRSPRVYLCFFGRGESIFSCSYFYYFGAFFRAMGRRDRHGDVSLVGLYAFSSPSSLVFIRLILESRFFFRFLFTAATHSRKN